MSTESVEIVTEEADGQPEPEISVADHAAQFGPGATDADASDADPDEPSTATPVHHAQTQARDRSGAFNQRGRHRAQSQQAGPDDVAAINALTKRIKDAEEAEGADITRKDGESDRVFALRRRAEVLERRREAKPSQDVPQTRPTVVPRASEPPPRTATTPKADADPRPDAKDAATYADGVYDPQYIEDLSAWKARGVWREERAKEATQQAERQRISAFGARIEDAKKDPAMPDYEAIAFGQTMIPADSVADQFVMRHKHGARVLYHLNKNPNEARAILSLEDDVEQLDALSLLAQRLAPSSSPAQAVTTGAAAVAVVKPSPRPPTPVRTGHARTEDEGPPDRDLSIAEHQKYFGKKSR